MQNRGLFPLTLERRMEMLLNSDEKAVDLGAL